MMTNVAPSTSRTSRQLYPVMIDINLEKIQNVTVIELLGELDSNSAAMVQEWILAQVGRNERIVLDMTRVTYMSSAGLRILLLLYRRIQDNDGRMVVAGLHDEVRDVMAITGFIDFFNTSDTRQDAIAILQ